MTTINLNGGLPWSFYRGPGLTYPSFCMDGVNAVFPATDQCKNIKLEISRVAFAGSKKYRYADRCFATTTKYYDIVNGTCEWLEANGFPNNTTLYIKFSPL